MVFDSHFHIIDFKYPLVANQGYLPKEFTCSEYKSHVKDLDIMGGAVVSGSFQGTDYQFLLNALKTLGKQYVGVLQMDPLLTDQDIIYLDRCGVRAIRFNLARRGEVAIEYLSYAARRVYELVGWHVEIYIDSIQLEPMYKTLIKLPKVVIDHFGLSKAGFSTLLKLVDEGVYVKATGFGRIDFDPKEAIKSIISINPDLLLFGSDLPSTRARKPFQVQDIDLIKRVVNHNDFDKVMYKNAVSLYTRDA